MNRLYFDFEVYSAVSIKKAPKDVYAKDPSTKIILCAYAFNDGPIETWEEKSTPLFRDALRDPSVELVAWNIDYERTVMWGQGFATPVSRWLDAMAHARYVGLPGRLKECAKIPMIGVPAEEATKSETLLITKFCMPNKKGVRNMPESFPEDWAHFVDYCRKDVGSMRHILKWCEARFPWPARERQIWEFDQLVNDRGMPVDIAMATHAHKETMRILAHSIENMNRVTGLENSNSVQQLYPWLKERGYEYDSLGKEFLEQALDSPALTAEAREVVMLRLGAAKTSVKKFGVMTQMASPEAA